MFPEFQLLLLFLSSTAVSSPSAEVLDIHDDICRLHFECCLAILIIPSFLSRGRKSEILDFLGLCS